MDVLGNGPADIIGGDVLTKGKRPYLASLGNGVSNVVGERAGRICGASLIHPSVVLTAAHCVTNSGAFNPNDWIDFKRYDLTTGLVGVDRRLLSQTEGRVQTISSVTQTMLALGKVRTLPSFVWSSRLMISRL